MTLDGVNQPTPRTATRPIGTAPVAAPNATPEGAGPGIAGDRASARQGAKTGLTGPFPQPDLNKLDWSRVPDPATASNATAAGTFTYRPVDLKDVTPALAGRMAGADANEQIVATYSHFDQAFGKYLGDPPVANWTTFGKYAAREAGQEIARLEVENRALSVHHPDGNSITGALRDIVKNPGLLGRCGRALVEDAAHKAGFSLSDLDGLVLGEAGAINMVAKLPKVWRFAHALLGDMHVLHKGLLKAHVGIYDDFAPTFDTFLRAEAAGGNGVDAVKAKVATGEINDPNGLLVDALGLYREAHAFAQQADATPAGPAKDALIQKRDAAVKRGTLLIGVQEQYYVAQPQAFDDPAFRDLMGKVSPYLAIHDANGEHALHKTGNWADFTTRMGFVEVPAPRASNGFTGNADPNGKLVRLKDASGVMQYYAPNPDPKARAGTIFDYFQNNATGAAAAKNVAGDPPPLQVSRTPPEN